MNKTDSIISDYFKHKVCYKEVTITHGPPIAKIYCSILLL